MIFRYKLLAYTTALLSFGVVHLSSNFATVSGRKSSTSSSDSEYSTPYSTPLNKTFEIPSRSCSSTPDSASSHHESEKNQSTPPSPFAPINSQPSAGDHSQKKQDSPRPTKTPAKVVFPAGFPFFTGDIQYPDQAKPEDQKQENNWGKLIHFFHLFIPFPRDITPSTRQEKSESSPDTPKERVVENPQPQDKWDRLICFFRSSIQIGRAHV